MGDPTGFIKIARKEAGYRPINERIFDFSEVEQTLNEYDRRLQASRCMDCGIPFCHWSCPLGSKIPEWQDALFRSNTEEAYQILHSTNSFPEITGRVCPAPCERSCVLGIHDEEVTIRENECATAELAFEAGFIKPHPPRFRTGEKVAIIGSGPAGLSAADILNRAGHNVCVFEKNDAPGGLLRYGIPDFKLNKRIIDRRLNIFVQEGIEFRNNVDVGLDIGIDELLLKYDAILIATGAGQPRDLKIEGRDLNGIHFAMDFLTRQNKVVATHSSTQAGNLSAKGKKVLIIGGGDTGSDCVGTAIRQQAESVTQIEILPKLPEIRSENNPWPYQPQILRTSSSHEEGCNRFWGLNTKRFTGINSSVSQVEVVEAEWNKDSAGKIVIKESENSKRFIDADLVLLSIGFVHTVHSEFMDLLGVEYDDRGNIKVNDQKQTSVNKVFAAGDAESGAKLVVNAIYSGYLAAQGIIRYLTSE